MKPTARNLFNVAALPKLAVASMALVLTLSSAVQASSLITFSPSAASSPLSQSGSTDGVGWDVSVTGNNFGGVGDAAGIAPYVGTGVDPQGFQRANEISWRTPQLSIGETSKVTFTLSFDEPVANLQFTVRSFGLLLQNLGNYDVDGGIQSFTLTAFNGNQALAGSAFDVAAGNLISTSNGSNSLTGNALVQDLNGATSPPDSLADLEARRARVELEGLVTKVVLTFDYAAFSTALNPDDVRLRDFSFSVVPEPSTALLGLLGGLTLLRRNRR